MGVGFEQLLDSLCADVQASVLASSPCFPLSSLADVQDRLLLSQPPSQECLTPCDITLLRGAFPQLLRNFSEAEAVQLMLPGLRDSDSLGCVIHGVKKENAASACNFHFAVLKSPHPFACGALTGRMSAAHSATPRLLPAPPSLVVFDHFPPVVDLLPPSGFRFLEQVACMSPLLLRAACRLNSLLCLFLRFCS